MNVFRYLPITFTVQLDSPLCPVEFEKFCSYFSLLQKTDLKEVDAKMGNLSLPQNLKNEKKV